MEKEMTSAYVGLTLRLIPHWKPSACNAPSSPQRAGIGPLRWLRCTGMVGDPSGKTAERQFLDVDTIKDNLECQKAQLEKFLDFSGENSAKVVNNIDWFDDMTFLRFIRDVGKHITVNYMMSKDSVKNRLEGGMSFTEFTYQLVQGYDFYHLWKEEDCMVQMGGSDQWGNIVTGTEPSERKEAERHLHQLHLLSPRLTEVNLARVRAEMLD